MRFSSTVRIPLKKDLPDDYFELRRVPVELPRLSPDSQATCPLSMQDIQAYLDQETRGVHDPSDWGIPEFNLQFLRTALVEGSWYWIWRFADVDGAECFLTVSLNPDRKRVIGYDECFGLTPEQFILADYYDLA